MKYTLKFGFLDRKNGMVKKKKIYIEDEEVGLYSGQVRNGEILEPELMTFNEKHTAFLANEKAKLEKLRQDLFGDYRPDPNRVGY
jgi:hypothetical protein